MTELRPQPHTTSYYAASANDVTDYDSLKGDQVADVCVIGAGFTGISAALHLAERGYKVHVVEANRVGWGASGRNGGQLIGGISGEWKLAKKLGADGERQLWELRWAGHDIIRQRVQTYNIDCDLKWGYLDVAIKRRHLRGQEEELELLERHNFPHEYRSLSAEETRAIIGTDAYAPAARWTFWKSMRPPDPMIRMPCSHWLEPTRIEIGLRHALTPNGTNVRNPQTSRRSCCALRPNSRRLQLARQDHL